MGFFEQRQRTAELKKLLNEQAQILNGDAVKTSTATQSAVEIALKTDVDKIRAMPSLAERNDYKRDHFLPKWLPYVDSYIQNGENYPNLTLAYCLVYCFDVGAFEKALALTEVAIKQQQALPDNFSSSPAAFASSFILEWAERCAQVGQSFEPYFSQILRKVVTEWTLHEVIQAKWLKFTAQALITTADGKVLPAQIYEPHRLMLAQCLLERAFTLNPKSGVKSLLERIQMRLKALKSNIKNAPNGGQLNNQEISQYLDDIADYLIRPPLSESEYLTQRNEADV